MSTPQVKTPAPAAPETHAAFEWLRSETIDSLNLRVEEYRHRATGAQYIHLAADNPENVFLVALRTVPMDSTGVAHMLEHTALCGSERYPVRDPFFMMIRRSLNTFMNAFTSSDWTAYPFASKNRKDFNNLMDVYLDAVFFSRLDALDFAQEGHRVEFEKPDDPDTELVFKGVVFNEMKGAMSSPVSTLWQTLGEHLFPTTTYHYNSGGDPQHIPDLSYAELKDFYRTHYHPSNAVIMTYGDIPALEHQARMEQQALSRFQRLDVHIAVEDEQRLAAPVSVTAEYALDEGGSEGDRTHIVMGWLLGHNTELKTVLKAHLLSSVLLENGASPLRLALERSDLGNAASPLCGLEDSNHEMSFMCGLEGSKPENTEALQALVLGVLQEMAEQGVPRDHIEAALHQLELHQREVGGDGYPYGLQLILDCLPSAIHRGDPVALLNLDPVLEELRRDIEDPTFIQTLVKDWLLDNPHRVCLTMRPDPELNARRMQAETARLAAMKAAMDDKQKADVVELAARLAERQAREDDPEVLPKVGLEDIPAEVSIPEGESQQVSGMPLTRYAAGTNGLVYQQVVVELPALDAELMSLLPTYTACLTELGAGGRDYLETQHWQSSVSGGIHAYTSLRGAIDDEQAARGHFVLSGKALARNHGALAELMQATLESLRFDEHSRMREIVAQRRARSEQSVTGQGHGLAMMAAVSGMSPVAAMSHRMRGLAGIHGLKVLDDGLDKGAALAALAAKLESIHQAITAAPRQFLLVGEGDRLDGYQQALAQHWNRAPAAEAFRPLQLDPLRRQVREAWTTSTQVNFCAKAYATVPVEHPDAAALAVLGGFLRNGFLHRVVREQGGAYGGGAGHDSSVAAFRFYSYRDPRLAETLADFDHAIEWLLDKDHPWRQVEEAILGVVGDIDKPSSPAGEAKHAFHSSLYGRSPEQRRRARERVLKVSLADLQRVGATYLTPEQASVAVVTSADQAERCAELGMEVINL